MYYKYHFNTTKVTLHLSITVNCEMCKRVFSVLFLRDKAKNKYSLGPVLCETGHMTQAPTCNK